MANFFLEANMTEVSAVIFMGCCIFIPMIFVSIPSHTVETKEVVKYIEKPVYIEKQVAAKSKPKENKLLNDAIQCLISLGMKKPDAKKKAEEMFAGKNYESIESFLLDVYKK